MKRRLRLLLLRAMGAALRRHVHATTAGAGDSPQILVLRPDHLGDVLLSRPAIDALTAALPDAVVTLAVGPWGRSALGPIDPAHLIVCPFPGFSRGMNGPLQRYRLLLHYALLLRRGRYDIAVVLRPDHWWGALLVALAGIPIRVGYATPETAPFLTVALERSPGWHAVEEGVALADAVARATGYDSTCGSNGMSAMPAPPLPTVADGADSATVARLLGEAGIGARTPLIVLHPGAGSHLKAWPIEHFAYVGAQLAGETGARIAVTGSATERSLAQELCDALPGDTLNLAGSLSWRELEALLARATLVLGVDSGPLHLAVAAGTASVALFGPADPTQFAPWGPPARHRTVYAQLACRPCRRLDYCYVEPDSSGPPPCMRAIDAARVLTAARAVLQTAEARP
jgi:ADP-heptose:LPS heptosyltransferase